MQRRAGGVAAEDDEVDLHVRRFHVRMGAEEAAGITGADGQQPLARDDVAQAGGDAVPPAVDNVVHGDRLGAAVLHAHLQMILQIGADARHVGDHVDAVRSQQIAAGPSPESCSSCGELNAPPATITSPFA